jgi:hypothetical protein
METLRCLTPTLATLSVLKRKRQRTEPPKEQIKEKEKHLHRSFRFGRLFRFPTAYMAREFLGDITKSCVFGAGAS